MPRRTRTVGGTKSQAPDSKLTPQQRKQQLMRNAILDAAMDLFGRKGFDETTVEEIALAAGTSRRSFFRYFESKSDLLAQPVVGFGKFLTDTIDRWPASYSFGEMFRSTVLYVAQDSAKNPQTRKIMEIMDKYEAARAAQVGRLAEVQDQVVEAFARRCRNTKEGKLEADVLAGLTLSMLRAVYFSWFRYGTQDIIVITEQVFAKAAAILGESESPELEVIHDGGPDWRR